MSACIDRRPHPGFLRFFVEPRRVRIGPSVSRSVGAVYIPRAAIATGSSLVHGGTPRDLREASVCAITSHVVNRVTRLRQALGRGPQYTRSSRGLPTAAARGRFPRRGGGKAEALPVVHFARGETSGRQLRATSEYGVPLRGVRDDLLRERDQLVGDGVGDVAPPDDRQRARLGVDERHVGDFGLRFRTYAHGQSGEQLALSELRSPAAGAARAVGRHRWRATGGT